MVWDGPRVVKVWCDDVPGDVHLILVRDPAELARLGQAPREYVRADDADSTPPPIIDLVTDLFHYSAREARFHVADLIRIAVEHYEAERMPQTTP